MERLYGETCSSGFTIERNDIDLVISKLNEWSHAKEEGKVLFDSETSLANMNI